MAVSGMGTIVEIHGLLQIELIGKIKLVIIERGISTSTGC
jgi:hypothetical protein